jgi:hypothetical protein
MLAGFLLCGCDRSPPPATEATAPASNANAGWAKSVPASTQPAYAPEQFRSDISSLIASNRYEDAVIYLRGVDPARQADHDRAGFLAVAWDAIVLPGAEPNNYDPKRDWCFPGTQDAIEHWGWQSAAQTFATKYNQRRRGGGG